MTQQVDQVFLASRFGEFSDLRSTLTKAINLNRQPKLKIINLDDCAVTSFPPLTECILHVKNSNFFILLLGDEYGSIPTGHEKSYTHQEYEEAYKNELETRILVFCIGNSYSNNRIYYSDNPTMSQWQRDLEDRHTIGFFSKPTSVEETGQLAEKITYQLLNTVYDRYFGQVQFDDEFSPDDADVDENDIYGEENEIDKLENLDRSKSADIQPSERSSKEEDMFNYLTIIGPSKEAQKALEMGEKSIAVKLFERIIDNRPLDILSNYWLAKLYLSVGGKKYLKKSIELATRAAKTSAWDGSNIRTSSAYQIASKASAELGNFEEAKYYAETSIEFAKNYAKAYVQKARVLVMENPKNRDEIKILLENAINIHSGIISELFNDPLLKRHRDLIKSLYEKLLQKRINKLISVAEVENKLIILTENESYPLRPAPSDTKKFYDTLANSLTTQLAVLKDLSSKYMTSLLELGINPYEAIQVPKSVEAKKYFSEYTSIQEWYAQEGSLVRPEDILFKYYRSSDNKLSTYRWLETYPIKIAEINARHTVRNGDILFQYILPSNLMEQKNLEIEVQKLKNELGHVTSELKEILKSRNVTYKTARAALIIFVLLGLGYGFINLKDNILVAIGSIIGTLILGAKFIEYIRLNWGTERLEELRAKKPVLAEKFNTLNTLYESKKSHADYVKTRLRECIKLFEDNVSKIPTKIRSKCHVKSINESLYPGDWVIIQDENAISEDFIVQKSVLFIDHLDDITGKSPLYKVVSVDKKNGTVTLSRDLSYFDIQ